MGTIISILAFIGTVASFGGAVFVFFSNLKTKKMQNINHGLDIYIKKKDFLLMKNDGENPCEIKNKFKMPLFSQESDFIIRRKFL